MTVEASENTEHPHHTAPEAEPGAPQETETETVPASGDELERMRHERDDLFARLQRLSAEFDNYQKRTKREKSKWADDALRGAMESFLPVLDNLDYAVAAFDREVKDPQSLRQGVELVREELLRQMSNQGVAPIESPEGTPFDSEKHLAIAVHEEEGLAEEQVAYLARAGYMLHDTVLRPAQVGVKKPPAKA